MSSFFAQRSMWLWLGTLLAVPVVNAAGTISFHGSVVAPMCAVTLAGINNQAQPSIEMRGCAPWQAKSIQVQRHSYKSQAQGPAAKAKRDIQLYVVSYP